MKNKIISLLLVFVTILSLVSCHKCGNEVSRTATDCEFIKAHYTTYYTYIYTGETMIPVPHCEFHPDEWKIKYLVTYEDGCTKEKWYEVSEEEYNAFKECEKNDIRRST